ncbi:MAG: DinB family protein [Acidobacteriota bacterium]
MNNQIIKNYLADAARSFRGYKKLAERAIEQVSDEEFFASIDSEANSIALIVKHIAGNLRSRWTDFLTTDGEKDFRDRDTEFEVIADTRESLMQDWETGWKVLFDAIEPLTPEDFSRSVTIRGESHTIVEALNRQMTHYAYHVGQIVLLAKHFRTAEWRTLSVPRKQSAQFNQFLAERQLQGEIALTRLDAAEVFKTEKSEP